MDSEKIPTIEINYSWTWSCPNCRETNSTEFDGESFPLPLICEDCETVFKGYHYEA